MLQALRERRSLLGIVCPTTLHEMPQSVGNLMWNVQLATGGYLMEKANSYHYFGASFMDGLTNSITSWLLLAWYGVCPMVIISQSRIANDQRSDWVVKTPSRRDSGAIQRTGIMPRRSER